MDRNVALAVFFFFSIVANVGHAKKFRYLAAAPQQNNPTSAQISAENKPDHNQNGALNKPENIQPSNNSPPLELKPLHKTNLVSPPPQNQAKDNGKIFNFLNPGSSPDQNQSANNEKTPKGSNIKDSGKNLSPDDNGKNLEHVNGTDLLSPSPVKKNVNGTDLLSPSPAKKHANGTDLLSPPVNETDNGKNGGVKEKTTDDKRNETDKEKNGEGKEKTIDKKSNETDNGKNGGAKENTIDDKSIETDNGKDDRDEERIIDDKSSSELGVNETCEGLHKCKDLETLIACIQSFDTGSRELVVLIQNEGEKTLIVNLTIPTTTENHLKPLKVSKHQIQKMNISLSASKNTRLILNAGNGECVLQTDRHEPDKSLFIYHPSYDKLLTPISGAYFLILSVLIFGGTWSYCMCRKRRSNDGVPYQELEMGLPESISATNVETAEGWDQGWDDDWDENNAVKSPGASHIGSISANGLTSRSLNRDSWENDCDE